MSDPTADFFDDLGRRGHERVLEGVSGTIRFDLEQDHEVDRWFVVITQGDLRVSKEERGADCVVRARREVFGQLVTGQTQLHAAWLRNELRAEGDIRLGRLFQRTLPGPPGARHPRAFALERRRRA